jgi:PPE-repeat protein
MWIQAATTMTAYQAVSTTALAAAPQTDAAPQIVNSTGASSDSSTLPIVDNDSGNPYDLSWYLNRITEVTQTLQRDIGLIEQNPVQGLTQLWADVGGLASDEFGHAIEFVQAFPEVLAVPLIVPAGAIGGLAGLGGLAAIPPEAADVPADAPAPTPQTSSLPALTGSPVAVGAPGASPTSAPASAPASPVSTAAHPVPTSPPPPAAGPGFVPPYAVGPPGIGTGSGMTSSAGAGDRNKAAQPNASAAAAAVAATGKQRRPRRRRVGVRGYAHEFMEMNINIDPDWGAPPHRGSTLTSDRGAGPLGFAGTVRKTAMAATGLATLASGDFGGGPTMPMVPGSWHAGLAGPDDAVEEGGARD